jgi:hypothetical protein
LKHVKILCFFISYWAGGREEKYYALWMVPGAPLEAWEKSSQLAREYGFGAGLVRVWCVVGAALVVYYYQYWRVSGWG